jgi:hypothetical protein
MPAMILKASNQEASMHRRPIHPGPCDHTNKGAVAKPREKIPIVTRSSANRIPSQRRRSEIFSRIQAHILDVASRTAA